MILVFCLFLIFGLYYSKLLINFKEVNFTNNKIKYKVIVYLLLFDFIPIYIKIFKQSNKKGKSKSVIKFFEKVKTDVKELNIKIEIGLADASITTWLVTALNVYLSFFYKRIMKRYSKNYKYNVIPNYGNKILLNFKVDGKIKIKTLDIIKNIIKRWKDERTSNRKFNENCNE